MKFHIHSSKKLMYSHVIRWSRHSVICVREFFFFLKGPDLAVDTYSGNHLFHFFSSALLSAKCVKLYHPDRAKLNNGKYNDKKKYRLFYARQADKHVVLHIFRRFL